METGTYQLIGIGVQTVLFLLAGYGMVIRTDSTVGSLKAEVKEIQTEIKTLSSVVTQIAVQAVRLDGVSQRINMLDERVEELRREAHK